MLFSLDIFYFEISIKQFIFLQQIFICLFKREKYAKIKSYLKNKAESFNSMKFNNLNNYLQNNADYAKPLKKCEKR